MSNKNTTGCLSGVICKAQPPEGLGKGEESVYGEITDLSLWSAFSSGNPAALGKGIGRNTLWHHMGCALDFLMEAMLPPRPPSRDASPGTDAIKRGCADLIRCCCVRLPGGPRQPVGGAPDTGVFAESQERTLRDLAGKQGSLSGYLHSFL